MCLAAWRRAELSERLERVTMDKEFVLLVKVIFDAKQGWNQLRNDDENGRTEDDAIVGLSIKIFLSCFCLLF